MGRKVDVDDLVTAADIAGRLGLSEPQVVHTWRDRHDDYPEPLVVRGTRVVLWSWVDVARWARATDLLV